MGSSPNFMVSPRSFSVLSPLSFHTSFILLLVWFKVETPLRSSLMASVSTSLSHPLSSLLSSEPLSSSSSSSLLFRGSLSFSPPLSHLGNSSRSLRSIIVRGGGNDAFLDLFEGQEVPSERGKPLFKAEKKKRPARLKPRRISPPLPVPDHILKPPYVGSGELPDVTKEHQIHDAEGLVKMRAACKLAARVLENAGTLVRPSLTTNEIDEAVHQMIIDAGAYPSPLGYGGFPKSVCTSVNECMCHGIPDSRQLRDGDIVNIDVTVYLDGYHGDTSKTYLVGEVSNEMKALVKVTEGCLARGISFCKAGVPYRIIGNKISEAAEALGFNVVDRFVGHGVGTVFHSEPLIYHTRNKQPGSMIEGETFTIEPILTMGTTECKVWDDNWTTLTRDGKPAAQFEHTILITKTGAEILTVC